MFELIQNTLVPKRVTNIHVKTIKICVTILFYSLDKVRDRYVMNMSTINTISWFKHTSVLMELT